MIDQFQHLANGQMNAGSGFPDPHAQQGMRIVPATNLLAQVRNQANKIMQERNMKTTHGQAYPPVQPQVVKFDTTKLDVVLGEFCKACAFANEIANSNVTLKDLKDYKTQVKSLAIQMEDLKIKYMIALNEAK